MKLKFYLIIFFLFFITKLFAQSPITSRDCYISNVNFNFTGNDATGRLIHLATDLDGYEYKLMYCTGGDSCPDDAGKTKSAWIIIDATGECETGNAAYYIYSTSMSVPLTAGGTGTR